MLICSHIINVVLVATCRCILIIVIVSVICKEEVRQCALSDEDFSEFGADKLNGVLSGPRIFFKKVAVLWHDEGLLEVPVCVDFSSGWVLFLLVVVQVYSSEDQVVRRTC